MGSDREEADRGHSGHPVGYTASPNVCGIWNSSIHADWHSIQLVFSNFYLGIALGALDFAAKYTAKNTRAWPFGGDNKEKATDEFYILERYGNFKAHLRAAEALADKAGAVIASIYETKFEKRDISARERGEAAEWVASVKIVATDTGLRVTSGLFEVTGARATNSQVGLDRFWRDIRTHSLHDPVSYKNRELGRFTILDEVPEPTWYTWYMGVGYCSAPNCRGCRVERVERVEREAARGSSPTLVATEGDAVVAFY
jgi:hypothetical protein